MHNGSKTEAERKQIQIAETGIGQKAFGHKTLPNGGFPHFGSRVFGKGAERPSNFTRITEATRKRNGSKTEANVK